MKYNGRLNQLEKKSRRGDNNSVKIKVARYRADDSTFEKCYALFQARLKLGLVTLDEPQKIFAGGEHIKELYKNLTIDQAKKIIKEFGNEA